MNEQNIENVSSLADNQNPAPENNQTNIAEKYKQMAINDINTIKQLVGNGVMTQEQGQNLMNFVSQKAFEKYTENLPQKQLQQSIDIPTQAEPMPDFFNQIGRSDVYDYLKNSNTNFDRDEISKISALVEKIENSAIQRYLEKQKHEKALINENETAKQMHKTIILTA